MNFYQEITKKNSLLISKVIFGQLLQNVHVDPETIEGLPSKEEYVYEDLIKYIFNNTEIDATTETEMIELDIPIGKKFSSFRNLLFSGNPMDVLPLDEYAFEQNFKSGFHKRFRDEEKQSDVYWLSWEAERRAGITVVPFGEKYLETLSKVEILDADSPNG
jgi:hypothetical protein